MVSVRRRWLLWAALALSAAVAGSPTVAQASFPGVNGKITWARTVDSPTEPTCIVYAFANGAGETTPLGCDGDPETMPRWSPTGGQLAYRNFAGQIDLVGGDGTTNLRENFFAPGAWTTGHTWSPDTANLAVSWYDCFDNGTCGGRVDKVDAVTGAVTNLVSTTDFVSVPDWSPDGTKIAFTRQSQIWTVLSNGTNQVQIPAGAGDNHSPSWSPDGQKIAFISNRDENEEVYVMNANGTNQTRLTNNVAFEGTPRWSPDGTMILFESDRDNGDHEIYWMDADGSTQFRVTNNTGYDSMPDWQPIVTGYVRPQSASRVTLPLVPAYNQCTSGNRTHGPPLVNPSCNPPVRSSTTLTVGSPDSNGKGANFTGNIKYKVVPGNAGTPTIDEADVTISVQITDVYRASGLTDYTGELSARSVLRVTDRNNTPNTGGPGPATVQDHGIITTVPCTATADPNVGATCNVSTTADAVLPGRVLESKRSVWAFLNARVDDGGPDSDGDTLGDNTPFVTQGVFVP